MATADFRRQAGTAVLGLIGAALFVYVAWHLLSTAMTKPTEFDDAYMFARYAHNFWDGFGHSWNRSQGPVYGSTSILHFAVVTLATGLVGSADGNLLAVASVVPALLGIVFLSFASGLVSRNGNLVARVGAWGAVVTATVAVMPAFQFHALTGMDTMLAFACNALLVLAVMVYQRRTTRVGFAGILAAAYLAFLARPDNGLYALAMPTLVMALRLGNIDRGVRRGALYAASFLAILAVDVTWKTIILRDPLPLAFYTKSWGFYDSYIGAHKWNIVAYLQEFALTCAPFLALIVLFARKRDLPVLAAFLLPVALTFAYFFTVMQIMGYHARFYYPALPFVIIGAAWVITRRVDERDLSAMRNRPDVRVAAVAAYAALILAAWPAADAYAKRLTEARTYSPFDGFTIPAEETPPHRGKWNVFPEIIAILEHAPEGVSIAASEHGYPGSALPTVTFHDLSCLHDRQWAHNGFSANGLFDRKPDIIWGPQGDYVGLVRDIRDTDRFWDEYVFFPEAFDDGIAIRRDSPHFDRIMVLVAASWERLYSISALDDYVAQRRTKP